MSFPNIEDIKHLERMLKLHPDKYYRCDNCGWIYEKGWSDEEIKKEYKENFPNDPEMKIYMLLSVMIVIKNCINKQKDLPKILRLTITNNGVLTMNEAKKVEMKITCKECHRRFKTYVFTERLCPKCSIKQKRSGSELK